MASKTKSEYAFSQSVALVVGVDYSTSQNGIPRLYTPLNDATAVADLLNHNARFQESLSINTSDVTPLLNPDRATLLASLATLKETLTEEDRLFFYFAGHGLAVNRTGEEPMGYLLLADAQRNNPDSYLSMADLSAALKALPCRHVLMILDCCFAGVFRWAIERGLYIVETLHQERFDRYIESAAWQVIASAAADETALDIIGTRRELPGQAHSPFATLLLRALSGEADILDPVTKRGDGVITATELFYFLDKHLYDTARTVKHRQTPQLWSVPQKHQKGEYLFLLANYKGYLPPAPELNEAANPYRGLRPYNAENAQFFFGRDAITLALVSRILEEPLTVVYGASGTGKSSVVKAGVIPLLQAGTIPERANLPDSSILTIGEWHILEVLRPGKNPLHALTTVLGGVVEGLDFKGSIDALRTAISRLADNNPSKKILLLVDQAEELLTLCASEKERNLFLDQLEAALTAHAAIFRVVVTIRSDFEPQLHKSGLEPRWGSARIPIPPMTSTELREAIEGPADVQVLYFDPPTLVDRLIDDVNQTPGALPLLSFTLSEMYRRYIKVGRDNRALIQEDYEALGGVAGSLTRRADEEYAALLEAIPANERATMADSTKWLLLRMVANEGGELARRRVPRRELHYVLKAENERVETILNKFVSARLLVKGADENEAEYVEPAHDALVRGWTQLYEWQRDEQETILLQRRLTQATEEWKQRRESKGFLWDDDPRLPQVARLLTGHIGGWRETLLGLVPWRGVTVNPAPTWLNEQETHFIKSSLVAQKHTLQRTAVITLVVILIATLAVVAFRQSVIAGQERRVALDAEATSIVNEKLARAAEATATVNEGIAKVAQAEADAARREILLLRLASESSALLSQERYTLALLTAIESLKRQHPFEEGIAIVPESVEKLYLVLEKTGGIPLEGHKSPISTLAFSPNGQWLATGGDDSTAKLWQVDTPTALPITLQGHASIIKALAFSPDNNWLATGSRDNTAKLWQVNNPTAPPITLQGHQDGVWTLAFSPDGKWLATGSYDGTAKLWQVDNLTAPPITLQGHQGGVWTLAFSPDGKWLATGSGDNTANLWQVDNLTAPPITLQGHQDDVWTLAFSPDGKWLATGSGDNTAKLWQVNNPTASPITLQGHQHAVWTLAFSPDGKWLATGSDDSTAKLWQVDNLTAPPITLQGHTNIIRVLAFSPDSNWLATGSWDNTAKLWQVDDPTALPITLQGHTNIIRALTFSSDGKWLATGSDDTTAKLWQMANPTAPPITLQGHQDYIWTLAFSSDDKWFVTGSADATAKLWTLSWDILISKGCATVGRNMTRTEWATYFPNEVYQRTCEQWPEPSEE